jgi:predicted GNAT superfamily acetyltransferase
VLPEFQGGGLGKKLKWAQRAETLRRGFALITWTYDPLQARNANLNLHTLGAVGRTYLKDFYGPTPALAAEAGVPTDRLFVEWPIRSRRVEERARGRMPGLDPAKTARAVERRTGEGEAGNGPGRPKLGLDRGPLLVELPRAIRDLRGRGGLVAAWQKAVREALVHYFRAGYRLDDFVFGERCFYVLRKERKRP